MEDRKTHIIILDRIYLPELIDSELWKIDDKKDGLPLIELDFGLYLSQKRILIEYSDSLIHLIRVDKDIENLDQYEILNIVATINFKIKEKMDLNIIKQKNSDAEYNPERFPGLVMRICNPKATFLIFSTGKMVVTGIRKVEDITRGVDKVIKNIKKAGIKVANPDITIHNFVSSENLHINIDLNLAAIVMENVMYEPEVFPGLIYRMQDPKVTFSIFSTGMLICTGAKDEKMLRKAISKLKDIIATLDLLK